MQPTNDPDNLTAPAAPAAPSSPPPAPPDCAAPAAPDAVPPASLPTPPAAPAAAAAPRRSHRASGEARALREKLDGNEILISLALLGEATKMQLLAFHFHQSPIRRIERHLKPLLDRGLVLRRTRYAFDTRKGVPVPSAHAYRLSPEGHALVANDPRYPTQTGTDEYRVRLPNPDATLVAEHDLLGSEAISWLVVLARGSGLSGMFLRREQQLDPQSRAPRVDAVLVAHIGGPQLVDGAFAWTKNPPSSDEQSVVLALEIDRNTEAISVIKGKAHRYQEAFARERTHDYWEAHYGRLPIVIWIAPTMRRLEAIHRVWREAWPAGNWVLATVAALSQGRCWIYCGVDDTLSVGRPFSGRAGYLSQVSRSWPESAGLEPPLALPPPPPTLPPHQSAEKAAKELPSVPMAPRIIEFRYSVEDAGPPPADEPRIGYMVVVYITADPTIKWEGYLYTSALDQINLGLEFANEPISITIVSLKFSATYEPSENPIVLEIARQVRHKSPEPWEYRAAPVQGWMRLRAFWAALRGHEEWAIQLLWFAPLALICLGYAGVALVMGVLAQLQQARAWLAPLLARVRYWFLATTLPIGGPDNAIRIFICSMTLAISAWAYRGRIARFARTAWPILRDYWQLILFSVFYILLFVGGLLLVWSFQ